jgi:phage antirepressor YoqD-like protein
LFGFETADGSRKEEKVRLRLLRSAVCCLPSPYSFSFCNSLVTELQSRVSCLTQTVNTQQAKIEADRPKVEFANQIGDCTDGLGIREFGIIFRQNGAGFGQDGLVRRLLDDCYLYRDQHGKLRPYAEYTNEDGLFWTKTTLISSAKGNFETVQVKITGKGQQYFLEKYLPQSVLPPEAGGVVLVDDYNGNEVAVEMATKPVQTGEGSET